MPTPWSKVILQQDEPYLRRVQARLLSLWGDRCEAIFSNRYLPRRGWADLRKS